MAVATLSFVIILLSAGHMAAQTQLSPNRPGVTPEGPVYFLPKTALRISVLVEKTTYTPGDFSPYAQRYLRMADVSQEPKTSFRVADIVVTPCPIPDSAKVFAVKFDARTVASRMTLSEDGRLLAMNVEDADDAEVPALFVPAPKPEEVNPRQFMGEDILSCGSTAKMAEMTAHEIYDLRENRTLLIKGQADFMPQDGRQMELMMNELDRQDRALSSLFVGTTQRDTVEHVLWVTPAAATQGKTVLFRLSQVKGLVEADDLSGKPFYYHIEDITQLPAPEENGKKAKSAKTMAGIYVNVPGRLRFILYDGITPIITEEYPAPQFGQTMMLSGNLFNKRYATHLLLDPLTGAMLRLNADQPK